MRLKFLGAIVMSGIACLAGCATSHPPPAQPQAPMPAQWSAQQAPQAPDRSPYWWKNFNDAKLDSLVDLALNTNNDFSAAAVRVKRARLQVALTDSNRLPGFSAGAFSSAARDFSASTTSRTAGLTSLVSYEVDLWGNLASQTASSLWQARAEDASCRAFAATLAGTTAKLYWQIAYLNQLIMMADADLDYAQRTLELARERYEVGSISKLNADEAALSLSTQQAARTQLVQQRAEARNALAILFDRPPESAIPESTELPDGDLPPVGAGLPADVLANRPDLQAAELRLRGSIADIDVARTSFYPSIALTGNLGTASSSLTQFLQNPIGALAAVVTTPLLHLKTAKLTTSIAETQYEEAALNFRQRLFSALAEVENSLSARTQLHDEEQTLRRAVAQAKSAEAVARTRFEAGATDVQLWLDAQQRVRSVQRSLVVNRLNQYDNQADLYRALGLGLAADRLRCGGEGQRS